jgi:hypothetical protein
VLALVVAAGVLAIAVAVGWRAWNARRVIPAQHT